MTRIRRLWVVVVLAAAVVCAGSGCTVIPVSGPYTMNDAAGADPLTKPFQRLIATSPQPGWGIEQTISGLQAAMAAYADDPTVLPQYLTADALKGWTPSGAVTVLDDRLQVDLPEQDGAASAQRVTLKAKQVARIEEDGTYVPQSGNWGRPFDLVKVKEGGYRVSGLPDGLILTRSDVERAYRPTKLYYLNGSTQDRLVVDNVRLRLKPAETYAKVILERLLKQPSGALVGAATTAFPPGTKVESVRSAEDESVVINLSGPLDLLDLSGEDALMAQIRYSLNNNDVAKGRSISVLVDGEPYTSHHPNTDDQRWLDNSGNSAYYVSNGAVHYLTKDGPGGAVAGPAGERRQGYSDFAISKKGAYVAARTSTGISVAPLAQGGQWQEVIQGTDLTPPSWHRDGSLWTFDRKNRAVLRYDPAAKRGPETVSAPGVEKLDVTNLRVARDGVRVVVTTGKNTVWLGALTVMGGLELSNLRSLTTTEAGDEIRDAAWRDDEHLLVLVQTKAGQILNEIDVGDGAVAEIPLKDPLQALAALNERVLAESEPEKKGPGAKLLELNEDQSWTSKIDSDVETPLFPLG
ncbi:LpqB family beta-propeller domain-containing protein [Nonomuraea sp. 10N515B]|uniref:LpqB family beta-propeller domain-containing protein n=1 Tax=Nonomuraea sp. 10N515B TaxID=3457422 RepID=UPI003FCC88ED